MDGISGTISVRRYVSKHSSATHDRLQDFSLLSDLPLSIFGRKSGSEIERRWLLVLGVSEPAEETGVTWTPFEAILRSSVLCVRKPCD